MNKEDPLKRFLSSINKNRSMISKILLLYFLLFSQSEGPYDYQWTKAICEENTCRDYLITCLNGKELSISPISGFATFDKDFTHENKENCPY